ncbi:MAG: response regulator transcription factor [Epsilonproteobacteria bacterium]|nr:response regulator transcription factor [Campylobacterota bacterium]
MRILLMEDDPVLSDILIDFLQGLYHVDHAYNADEVNNLLASQSYDLFIFDINVAGQNGLELLKELREFNETTPTIFITAYTDTEHLKRAFDAGAHDYIKKPFELEELDLRIQNIKRIFHIQNDTAIDLGDGVLFLASQHTIQNNGKTIQLGQKNSALLRYFLNNKKRVISSDELLQNIWDYDTMPSEATLRSHIRDLREAIGKEKITTIRGEGYLYE